jgi:hypothetical protein
MKYLTKDYMEYYDDDSSASITDMEDDVEIYTDNCSASIADNNDNDELYDDNGLSSMKNMVEQHHEYKSNDDMVESHTKDDMDEFMEYKAYEKLQQEDKYYQ